MVYFSFIYSLANEHLNYFVLFSNMLAIAMNLAMHIFACKCVFRPGGGCAHL